jgi:hypothetical protein
LTEVSVNVLEPTPLEPLEDIVTFVAAMVKLGVAADAFGPDNASAKARSDPMRTNWRFDCMAETFPLGGFHPARGVRRIHMLITDSFRDNLTLCFAPRAARFNSPLKLNGIFCDTIVK